MFTVKKEEHNWGVVGTHSIKEGWRRRALDRRRPLSPTKTGLRSAWLVVAVCPRRDETWELHQTSANQPGREERRRRKKEPLTNGARPRGRLRLNKQEKKRGLLNKPG